MQNNDSVPPPITEPTGAGDHPLPASEKARGEFDLRGKRRTAARPGKLYVAVGALILFVLLILGGVWWYVIDQFGKSSTGVDEANVHSDASLKAPAAEDDSMRKYKQDKIREEEEKARLLKEKAEKEALEDAKRKGKSNDAAPSPAPTGDHSNGQGTAPKPITPLQRKLAGGVFASLQLQDSSSYVAASGSPGAPAVPTGNSRAGGAAESPANGLGGIGDIGGSSSRASLGQLSGTGFSPTTAYLAPPGKYLLAHATYGRCVLYTEIITENPGLIDCRLADPIYSSNGETVIAEAGAKLTGEQRVEVKPGQQNVFTSWTELETSNGVRAPINSLGAGPMGASGTAAWIDYHYKERFGGAIALTFIQDLLQAASNSTQSSNSGFTVNNSEQNVESMASKVLENSINIQNTGHILPGTVLTVVFARDIDFSTVFENR